MFASVVSSLAAAALWIITWQIAASIPPFTEGSGFMGMVAMFIAPPTTLVLYPLQYFLFGAVAQRVRADRPSFRLWFTAAAGIVVMILLFLFLNWIDSSKASWVPQSLQEALQLGLIILSPLASWLMYSVILDRSLTKR